MRGWFNEPLRHSLASRGVPTRDQSIIRENRSDTDIELLAHTLDESRYLDVRNFNEELKGIDFTFHLNDEGRQINGSFGYSTYPDAVLRYPKVKSKEEIQKLYELVSNLADDIPHDVGLQLIDYYTSQMGGGERRNDVGLDGAKELLDEGKDIYPHILMADVDVETSSEIYNFTEQLKDLADGVGKGMGDKL